MFALWLAKYAIGSKLKSAWEFILEHWKLLIFILVCLYACHEKIAHDDAVQSIDTLNRNIANSVAKQEAENAQKAKTAKILAEKAQKEYEDNIARLGLDRNKLRKDLANEKDNLNAMLDDSFRMRVQSSGGSTSSKVSEAASISTESARDRDRIITIIRAGQSCALDYNELWKSWLDNCAIYGCE